ncbi:lipopolysaccharide biosynthesis protein [Rossellomorea sp. H39__3]
MNFIYRFKKMNSNNLVILKNSIGTFFIKGGALVVSFITIPAYFQYFQEQQVLGLWFTILSVLTWILTFDFGIGNGLRNHLVQALASQQTKLAKKYISSSYIVIGILTLIATSVFLLIYRIVDWNSLFSVSENVVNNEILSLAVLIVFVGIMLQFFLKIITSVMYALQKSALTNLLSLISSLIILIYVSKATFGSTHEALITLSVVHVLAINLPLLVASFFIFKAPLKESRPSILHYSRQQAKEILSLGASFFWIQIMFMIITATNEFLISWLSGPDKVVEYQIYNKVFFTVSTLFTLMLTPIWSMVTKAFKQNDYTWIANLYKKINILMLAAFLILLLLVFLFPLIVDIWIGQERIEVNVLNSIVFALFGMVFMWSGILSTFVNGLGHLRIQGIAFTVGAFLKFPLAWIFVSAFNSWIGVIISNIVALGIYCIFQPKALKKFVLSKL